MIVSTTGPTANRELPVSYLAMLSDELHQLGGLLRASGEEIAQASREIALAPADHVGPPAVDAASDELAGGASASLGRIAVAVADVEDLLHRLAAESADAATGSR